MMINVAQRINALMQVVQNIIMLDHTTTSIKTLMTLMRRIQRHAYTRSSVSSDCVSQSKVKRRKVYINICIAGQWNESALIRADYLKRLDLDGKTKLLNISSVKDTGETIRVKEVKLQIVDHNNASIFRTDGVLSLERENIICHHNISH